MTSPPVTDAERKSYFQFSFDLIRKMLAATPEGSLWHYTRGESLIAIIETGQLWSTQVSCMNDSAELRYATSLLRDAFRDRRAAHTPNSDEIFLYDRLEVGLADDAAPRSEWFIVSLSEKCDDLSQWRAYGGGEGGYSIGLESAGIVAIGRPDQRLLARVNYDSSTHKSIATKVADETFQNFFAGLAARSGISREDWANVFLPAWADAMTYIAPVLKHPTFHDEAEWRIIRRLRPGDIPHMKYRQKQSVMTRHLPLSYTNATGQMPISGIFIGPSRYKEVSKVSVGDLLRTRSYPQIVIDSVKVSDIPFQSV